MLLIGIGNEHRRDDGVGLVVVRRLRVAGLTGIDIRELCGEGGELIEAWDGAERVLLFDAVVSGAATGTIHRLDAHQTAIPRGFFHYSSHAFGLAEAVETARALGRLPDSLVIYGIEAADFTFGCGLSAPVARAVEQVMESALSEFIA